MLSALILALAIPALAASAEPQVAVPAPPGAAPRGPNQEVKAGGVIRGRITSLDTGKPLRHAQIHLTAEGTITTRTASTSNDGRYEFLDVPAGRYALRVERSGYLALSHGQRLPGEQGRPLEIADKEIAEKVDRRSRDEPRDGPAAPASGDPDHLFGAVVPQERQHEFGWTLRDS